MRHQSQQVPAVERVKRVALMMLLSMGFAGTLLAWGQEGHRITAEVAERNLTPAAMSHVEVILEGESLAQVATWPDEIRSYPSWDCAQPFHFVTVPVGAEYPGEGVAEGDSVQALVYYTDVLRGHAVNAESRIALSFVVHLVGDLHQPLHAGRGCDRGGNYLTVNWFKKSVNFHTVWDSLLIQSENLSFNEWADFLNHAGKEEVAALQSSTPFDWVQQSQALLDDAYTCFTDADRCACFCGSCKDGKSTFGGCRTRECELMAAGEAKMSYAYKAVNLAVVRSQLHKGGLRLAGLLNWIFEGDGTAPEEFAEMADQVRGLTNYAPEIYRDCRGEASIHEAPKEAASPSESLASR